nr:hypothetical protein HK105_002441 [Polyrhizophydium stewartii]
MVAADIAGLLSRAAEVAGDMDLAGQASDAEGDASDGSGTPELAPEELAKQRRIERERHQALLAQLDTFEMASVLSALDSLVTASSSRGDSVAPTEADTTDAAKLLFMLRGASQADLLGNADDTAAGGGADAMGSASEGESSGPGSPVGAPDAGGSLLNSMLLAASQYDAGALDPRQPPLA